MIGFATQAYVSNRLHDRFMLLLSEHMCRKVAEVLFLHSYFRFTYFETVMAEIVLSKFSNGRLRRFDNLLIPANFLISSHLNSIGE